MLHRACVLSPVRFVTLKHRPPRASSGGRLPVLLLPASSPTSCCRHHLRAAAAGPTRRLSTRTTPQRFPAAARTYFLGAAPLLPHISACNKSALSTAPLPDGRWRSIHGKSLREQPSAEHPPAKLLWCVRVGSSLFSFSSTEAAALRSAHICFFQSIIYWPAAAICHNDRS